MDKLGHEKDLLGKATMFEYEKPKDTTVEMDVGGEVKYLLIEDAKSPMDAYMKAERYLYKEGYAKRTLISVDREVEDLSEYEKISEEDLQVESNIIDIIEYHAVRGSLVVHEGKVNGEVRDIVSVMQKDGEYAVIIPIAVELDVKDKIELDIEE